MPVPAATASAWTVCQVLATSANAQVVIWAIPMCWMVVCVMKVNQLTLFQQL
jgi:hypothetical protein